eukprot:CAMPEP_0168529066 /NCGR_PEP_ID=MMETSP0405-20121227/13669_1 /TAXON_ID=498012 /ORGANISM="Trichosphaerium sp, Strain Am-I-7 wt" /LENGTH=215 /DNA_ID=CAMNT_0008552683 /DNA_START=72 /DNA_END=716 /DNA_ORIENTATION=-
MKEQVDLVPRMDALVNELKKCEPDIVALQENKKTHNALLMEAPYIRERYYVSEFTGQQYGFKVSLLSRFPLSSLTLYNVLSRQALVGSLVINDQTFAFGSTHLTSGNNPSRRENQIEFLYDKMKSYENAMLVGDFNYCHSNDDTSDVHLRYDYEDCWPIINNTEGFTRHNKRIDRMYLRSDIARPMRMKVVAKGTVQNAVQFKSISDHWGLCVTL